MRLFISWSGERSQALANALREWLPLVLHYADPWLSNADIEAGDRWALEVAKELDVSSFGITCVTAENISSPWILFEAGALAKSMDSGKVLPLLLDLDVRQISGPLAQFQAKKAEKAGVFEAIISINKSAQHPEPEDRVKALLEALWPQLEKKIGEIPKSEKASKTTRPQSEILEELVTSVRNLDLRYREESEDGGRYRRSKRSHMRLMMQDEISHRLMDDPKDPLPILISAAAFRDNYPWIYEIALDLYNSLRTGQIDNAEKARIRLSKVVEIIGRGPLSDELDDRAAHMLFRAIDRSFSAIGSETTRTGAAKSPTRTGKVKLV